MRFLPPEEPIKLYESGFEDDLLKRIKTSKMLSEVLDRIDDPLVVAIDGRWGTGKSYFLQRWVGAHRLQNNGRALTVYFDAFAHDYQSDPLISLVSVLVNRLPKGDESKAKKLIEVAGKFVRPATRIGLALASYGATEALNGIGDVAVDVLKGEADKALNDFWSREQGRHAAMLEFQSAIQALTSCGDTGTPTPLVIVVDELDRCRPDFALEVLEVIKHFFAVPNVHFVLGANLKALENSVRVRYGAGVDATAYLQKFVSFTMSLTEHLDDHQRTPVILTYASHMGKMMGIPNELLAEISSQLKILSRCNDISIRDVGKILSTAALFPEDARSARLLRGWRTILVTLLIARVVRQDIFPQLLDASISKTELVGFLNARKEIASRDLDNGERNQEYNHGLYILFSTWSYVINGGLAEDDGTRSAIASTFDSFAMPDDINSIPRRVYENWLSVFQLDSQETK